MPNPSLHRLLCPEHAVVIGGGVWGRAVIQQCRKIGFSGEIFVIHPSADEIEGIVPLRAVDELPVAVDAAFIGVNRNATIEVVRQLAAKGAGGAVCFASGFLEAKEENKAGEMLQHSLIEAAGDMPIIGPNCYGFVNYVDGFCLWPDQHGGVRVDTGVAIITQSSNMMINITMQARGLPIAFALTAGNQAQTSLADLGCAVLDDPRVTALGLHIEGIGKLDAFQQLVEYAAIKGKAIVALKVGRSALAQQATLSHTASLAGSDAAADALFSKLGVGRVNSLSELIETLKILHHSGGISGNNIVSASCSGGEASLIADTAQLRGHNLNFPNLTSLQHQGLKAALGDMVALANPLDYHTYIWGDVEKMADAYSALLSGPCDIGVIIVDFPRINRCDDTAWHCVIEAASKAHKRTLKPVGLLATLVENMPEDVARIIADKGLIPLAGLDEGLAAIAAAASCRPQKIAPLLSAPHLSNLTLVDEAASKTALAQFGLDIPHHQLIDADSDLAELTVHFPVAVKALGLAHKSEAGGVAIGIENIQSLQDAIVEMGQLNYLAKYLIEEMVTDPIVEILVGVVADPAHGYLLTIAAGGVYTEVLQDSTHLLVPASEDEILNALSKLKISPVFEGFRGKPAIHKDAVISAVMSIQNYVLANQDSCVEIEVNPLLLTKTRAVAVDALIRIGERLDV